ncbi:unnamed protein product [Microthlaspi erraticum]|uniref:Uncharacterized protein n=1 Tax=Microthlaspi erraticum TaxID=1685480 RepID=A0A6D2I5G2_9BRAS|nr:unnamed protein product [Microthlaspi erraticum]
MSRRQVPPLEPPSPSTVLLSSSLSTTLMNLHRNRSSLSTSRALSRTKSNKILLAIIICRPLPVVSLRRMTFRRDRVCVRATTAVSGGGIVEAVELDEIDRVAFSSAISFLLVLLFVVICFVLAIIALLQGKTKNPRFFRELNNGGESELISIDPRADPHNRQYQAVRVRVEYLGTAARGGSTRVIRRRSETAAVRPVSARSGLFDISSLD